MASIHRTSGRRKQLSPADMSLRRFQGNLAARGCRKANGHRGMPVCQAPQKCCCGVVCCHLELTEIRHGPVGISEIAPAYPRTMTPSPGRQGHAASRPGVCRSRRRWATMEARIMRRRELWLLVGVLRAIDGIGRTVVLFDPRFTLHDVAVGACARSGFVPNIMAESSQISFMLKLTAGGMGVPFMPKLIAEVDDHRRRRSRAQRFQRREVCMGSSAGD
jgi:hypothetical protein